MLPAPIVFTFSKNDPSILAPACFTFKKRLSVPGFRDQVRKPLTTSLSRRSDTRFSLSLIRPEAISLLLFPFKLVENPKFIFGQSHFVYEFLQNSANTTVPVQMPLYPKWVSPTRLRSTHVDA